jgi:hypothetical protein
VGNRDDITTQTLAMAVVEITDSLDLLRLVLTRITPPMHWKELASLSQIELAIDRARTLAHEVHDVREPV